MKEYNILIALVILIVFGYLFVQIIKSIFGYKKSNNEGNIDNTDEWAPDLTGFYKKDYFFTRNEYYFFKRLKNIFIALDLIDRYTIFSKVKVRDIISLRKGSYDTLKRTNQRHFDFLICDDNKAFQPIMAIELDDSSHNSQNSQKRDRLKNLLCEQIGLPLVRLYSSNTDDEIKEFFKNNL